MPFIPDEAPKTGFRPDGFIPDSGPGESAETPIEEQHPELPWGERAKAMNLSANSAVAARYLKTKGFEVADRGNYKLSVRKPGGKWYVVDPSKLEWSDISDLLGDLATGVGSVVGAVTAAGTALPTGPGAIAAGIGGAAAGGAVAEAGKEALGKVLGMEPTLGEAAGAVGREAAFGAVGEGAAQLARPVFNVFGRLLKTPTAMEAKASGAVGKEAVRVGRKELTAEIGPAIEATKAARLGLRQAKYQAKEAAEPAIAKMAAEGAEKIAQKAAAREAMAKVGSQSPKASHPKWPDFSKSPDYIREEILRRHELAEKLGVADDIEELSAQGLNSVDIQARIMPRLGKMSGSDARDMIRAVRARRGIPSLDEVTEFNAWRLARATGQKMAPSDAVRTMAAREAEQVAFEQSIKTPERSAVETILAESPHEVPGRQAGIYNVWDIPTLHPVRGIMAKYLRLAPEVQEIGNEAWPGFYRAISSASMETRDIFLNQFEKQFPEKFIHGFKNIWEPKIAKWILNTRYKELTAEAIAALQRVAGKTATEIDKDILAKELQTSLIKLKRPDYVVAAEKALERAQIAQGKIDVGQAARRLEIKELDKQMASKWPVLYQGPIRKTVKSVLGGFDIAGSILQHLAGGTPKKILAKLESTNIPIEQKTYLRYLWTKVIPTKKGDAARRAALQAAVRSHPDIREALERLVF